MRALAIRHFSKIASVLTENWQTLCAAAIDPGAQA
jgi:hypothetical protein